MNSSESKLPQIARPIVLYDGVCALCDATVNFIINQDPTGQFRFASLQSEVGRALLAEHHLDPDAMNTLVLIENGKAYIRSTAVLRICMSLGHGLAMLGEILIVIPEPLRDAIYNWIARHRYRWFGKRNTCRLPAASLASRFL